MTESEVVAEAPDVSDLLREGEALSRGRKYGEALDRFNRAIAMDPSSSMAWYNRGVLLEGQRKQREQSSRLRFVWTLNRTMHQPRRTGRVAGADGRCRRCRRNGHRALTHYPDHPELLDIRRRCQTGQTVEPDLPVQRPTPTATWEDEHLTKAMDKAGVTDAQAVLEESSHHDTDGDGVLDQEELERAASVVAAQQHVQETMVEDEWTLRLHRLKRHPSSQNLNTISQRWRISSTKRRVNSTPVIRKPPSGCCEIDSERTVQKTSRRGLRQRPPCID